MRFKHTYDFVIFLFFYNHLAYLSSFLLVKLCSTVLVDPVLLSDKDMGGGSCQVGGFFIEKRINCIYAIQFL